MKDKLKAFFFHLIISIIIALICLSVVYLVWYPAPLYKATGVTHIFLLMLGIDIVLGPLLTFIVYKKGKKTLRFDLIVIAILQISALLYGLYNVYDGRPAWIAYNIDRFDLIRNNEIDTRKLSEAAEQYQKVSSTGAKYVAAVIPKEDIEQKNQILFDEVSNGIAPSQRPELYQPLLNVETQIIERAQDLKELDEYNDTQRVAEILSQYPQADGFVPLKANDTDMSVLINKKQNGKIIDIVDLRPWK